MHFIHLFGKKKSDAGFALFPLALALSSLYFLLNERMTLGVVVGRQTGKA